MNKIKIYFFKDWVYIAPPWLEIPEHLEDVSEEHFNDIGINLKRGTAYVTNNDYYCSVNADEMRTLSRMLEMAAYICDRKSVFTYENVKTNPGEARSCFPDAEIFIVEE